MPDKFDFRIKHSAVVQALETYRKMETLLEKEKENQLQNVRNMEGSWKGSASVAARRNMEHFVENGIYGQTYGQVKAMRKSLESALPRINAMLVRCEEFPKQLKSNDYVSPYVPIGSSNTEYNDGILSLDYDRIDSIKDACDKVMETTDSLTKSLADIVGDCAGLIDGADECLEHLENASKNLHRIENFKTSFLVYAAGVRDLEEDLKVQWRAIRGEESGDHSPEQAADVEADAEEIPWTDEIVTLLCRKLEEYVQTLNFDKLKEVAKSLIVKYYQKRETFSGPINYFVVDIHSENLLKLLEKAVELELAGAYQFALAMKGIHIEGLPVREEGSGEVDIQFGNWEEEPKCMRVSAMTDMTAAWCDVEAGNVPWWEAGTYDSEWDRYIDLGLTGYVKYGYHEIIDYMPDGAMLVFGSMNLRVLAGSVVQSYLEDDIEKLDERIIHNYEIYSHSFIDNFWDSSLGLLEGGIRNVEDPILYIMEVGTGISQDSKSEQAKKSVLAVMQLISQKDFFTGYDKREKDVMAIKNAITVLQNTNKEDWKDFGISIVEAGKNLYQNFKYNFKYNRNEVIDRFMDRYYYETGAMDGKVAGIFASLIVSYAVAKEMEVIGSEVVAGAEGVGEGGRGTQAISNKFPNDNQVGKTFNFTIEEGKINIENGIQEVDFIIDMDGNLHIGRGHSYLSGGQNVQAAGTMKVNSQGYIRNITNESGHFQPTVSEALNYPQIFRNSGLNVDNTWIKISEFDTSLSNYIIDSKLFYNGPIQYMPK